LWAPRLDLVHSDRYLLDMPGVDARRGERVLAALDAAGLLDRRHVHRAEPASFRDLRRVHVDDYLDSLSQPASLLPIFGFELPDALAERAVESQRAMVGGTLAASRLALASGRLAVNLGGGLHHGFADKGQRFCIFNDVAVAVAALRAEDFAAPVLVIDLDLHDDDGTRSIFARDPSVHTFSIHNHTTCEPSGSTGAATGDDAATGGAAPSGGKAEPRDRAASDSGRAGPAGAATTVALGDGVGDDGYLAAVAERLPGAFAAAAPGLVFYLAGCDPAADDAIGNWRISADGMLRRDRMVYDLVRRRRDRGLPPVPMVMLLAGGYGPGAWRYTARFLSSLRPGGRSVEPPAGSAAADAMLARYRYRTRRPAGPPAGGRPGRGRNDATNRPAPAWRRAADAAARALHAVSRAAHSGPDGVRDAARGGASGESRSVRPGLGAGPAAPRAAPAPAATADWQLTTEDLLGSLGGAHRPFRLFGVFTRQQIELALERRGVLEKLRRLGFAHPSVMLDLDHPGGETVRVYGDTDAREMLAEVRLSIDRRTIADLVLLRVEWLLLQNPRAAFSAARPRLPGQDHPGLGMLREAVALLVAASERLQLDALLWVPAHYHIAVQSWYGGGRFLDPRDEGLFRALAAVFVRVPLSAATLAIDQGRVLDAATGQPFTWHALPMVAPAADRLRQTLDGDDYAREAAAAAARTALRLAPDGP
jgi:acetoin utilization deacetylase AcuC-like enzyme